MKKYTLKLLAVTALGCFLTTTSHASCVADLVAKIDLLERNVSIPMNFAVTKFSTTSATLHQWAQTLNGATGATIPGGYGNGIEMLSGNFFETSQDFQKRAQELDANFSAIKSDVLNCLGK